MDVERDLAQTAIAAQAINADLFGADGLGDDFPPAPAACTTSHTVVWNTPAV